MNLRSVCSKFFCIHSSIRWFNSGEKWFFQSPVFPAVMKRESYAYYTYEQIGFAYYLYAWSARCCSLLQSLYRFPSLLFHFWRNYQSANVQSILSVVRQSDFCQGIEQFFRFLLASSVIVQATWWNDAHCLEKAQLMLPVWDPRIKQRANWDDAASSRQPRDGGSTENNKLFTK